MKSNNLPFDPGISGWTQIIEQPASYPNLQERQTADAVVVGGGFAGLSAAKRLKDLNPKSRIVLLEARRIAEGPAGRNSGFMIDVPHDLGSENYLGRLEHDRQQILMNREAIEFASQAVEEYSMPKEAFSIPGKLNGAATRTGHEHNLEFAKHLENLDEECELLDNKAMKDVTGSEYYVSGLRMPGTAMIQPALYISQFAEGMSKSGVEIYEQTPVVNLEKQGSGWKLTTPETIIDAGTVVLAVNGHVEDFGYFNRRFIHIYLYASMTRRLASDEVAILGGESSWGITPSHSYGTTVRRITGASGDRVIIRNGFTWAPSRRVSEKTMMPMIKVHNRTFSERFPQLRKVTMEYSWGGLLCLSRNSSPAFGELDTNLYSACCQNGLGTTKGTLSGKLVAELISGVGSSSLDYFLKQPSPNKLPPEPFASIGGEIALRWGEFRAGKEK